MIWGVALSYTEDRSPIFDRKFYISLLPFIGILIWQFTPVSDYIKKLFSPPRNIEAEMLSGDGADSAIKQLKISYPEDFSMLVSKLENGIESGRTRQGMNFIAFNFMRQWVVDKADAVIHAPEKDLVNLANANFALSEYYKNGDADTCKRFMEKGLDRNIPMSEKQEELVTNITKYTILAAKAGETGRVERQILPLSTETDAAITQALNKVSLTPLQMKIYMQGTQGKKYAPIDICAAGHAKLAAVQLLDQKQKADVTAALVLHSTEAQRMQILFNR